MNTFANSFIGNLIINIIVSLIIAGATTLIVYFKFLKHIPETTKKEIESLLNERLNYETANHNAIVTLLNPDTKQLSKEHDHIFERVERVDSKLTEQSARERQSYELMKSGQREIVDSIRRLDAVPTIWQELILERDKLEKENQQLRWMLERYEEQQANRQHRDRGMER